MISQLKPQAPAVAQSNSSEKQEALRAGLIESVRLTDGEAASDLLSAQLAYLEAALDAKEDKHFVQQHAYVHLRSLLANTSAREKQAIAKRIPWFAPALLPRTTGQLCWPENQPAV